MEFLPGIDKNFIENLMEIPIEGHQKGETVDVVDMIDEIEKMERDHALECANTTEIMFVRVVQIHMNRFTRRLHVKVPYGPRIKGEAGP